MAWLDSKHVYDMSYALKVNLHVRAFFCNDPDVLGHESESSFFLFFICFKGQYKVLKYIDSGLRGVLECDWKAFLKKLKKNIYIFLF